MYKIFFLEILNQNNFCIKYFESHFKISTSTANRWYNRIYNELIIPDIHKALEIKSYKETVESEIEECMKKLKELTIEEKEIMEKNNAR